VAASDFGGACKPARGAAGLWQVAVAPGGTHAYGMANSAAAIVVFDRNPATGALTQRAGTDGCLSDTTAGCAPARGLVNGHGIVVSPDGLNVYVAGGGNGSPIGGALAVFDRNPSTGALTQKPGLAGCVTPDGVLGCATGRGVLAVTTVLISPDGRTVYTKSNSGVIGTFQRNPASGTVTQNPDATGCIAEGGAGGCAPARGIAVTRQMALSPDGRSLYVPSRTSNALVVLDRDSEGTLRQKDGAAGCLSLSGSAGCTLEPRMGDPLAASVSPDSRHVYVSVVDGMLTFARAGDGSLRLQSCLNLTGTAGCLAGRHVRSLSYSAVSPDGQTVVATSEAVDGIVALARDANGDLTQPAGGDGCVTATGAAWMNGALAAGQCFSHAGLGPNGQVTMIDDGSFIAGSHGKSSLAVFKRDFAPRCQDQAVTVTRDTVAALALVCSDRNGDPLALGIATDPIAGALGAVDQGAGRVLYNPFAGYLGADTVRYRATSTGLQSNDATIALTVVAPPVPPAPPVKPRTVDSAVTYNWDVKGSRHRLARLIVRGLPLGSTVTLTCSGKRCPLKRLTIKRSRKSTMNVLNAKALNGKHKRRKTFRAGQTVDVRVAAPGMNTKVLRFKLRRGKVARHSTYCIPAGLKKAQRGSCGG
jgi:DNA-binding beta-propeller fold protein YncE